MNGKKWRISIIVAMLEYGESNAGGHDVVHIAHLLFPKAHTWYGEADFELDQFRKLLAFMRDEHDPPSLEQQLRWALTNGIRKRHTIPRDFRNFLISHPCRSRYLRDMTNVRQPVAA